MENSKGFSTRSSGAGANKMAVMPMPRLVMGMALPLMVSLLVQSLYNIVDSIFVAKLSEDALAATSLAYPVQMLMISLAVGTSVGINALLSRLLGQKNAEEIGNASATGFLLAILSSVPFMICGAFFAGPLAALLAKSGSNASLCEQYLRICMIFCTGTFLETMVQRFLQSSGKTVLSMVSLIVGAVTNIILDPILIFGYLGFPAMGITGAAIATVIGQWLGALTALLLNKFRNPEVRMRWKGFRLRLTTVKTIYKVGFPTILTQTMASLMNFSMNSILLNYSTAAVAFFGVYYKLQNFLFMPMNGLGQASIPIIGYNFGAGNKDRIRETLRTTLPIAVGIALAATLLFMILPRQLLGLFSPTDDLLSLGVPALRTIAPTFVLASVTMILGYALSGLGNGLVNMIGTAIRQLLVFVPLAYLFSSLWGVENAWYAFWVSEICAVLFSVFASLRYLRKKEIL